jgi:hypothetical protein
VVLKIAIAAEYICSIFLFSAFGIFWLGLEPVKSYANLCTNISQDHRNPHRSMFNLSYTIYSVIKKQYQSG